MNVECRIVSSLVVRSRVSSGEILFLEQNSFNLDDWAAGALGTRSSDRCYPRMTRSCSVSTVRQADWTAPSSQAGRVLTAAEPI